MASSAKVLKAKGDRGPDRVREPTRGPGEAVGFGERTGAERLKESTRG